MLYTIIITHADGTQTAHTTQADTAKQAHEQTRKPNGATVKAYPTTTDGNGAIIVDGVQAGALLIVRRTTANTITREGTPAQYQLYNQARTPHPEQFPDIADMISVAQLAILEAIADGAPIDEQYHNGYKALNNYLYSMRSIQADTRPAHIYIEDINGDIISVNNGINTILKPDERYTPEPDTDTADITAKQRQTIKAIAATLTPTQITVLRYFAKGYTLRQIADRMKRSAPTIQVHINKIREKALALYPNGIQ